MCEAQSGVCCVSESWSIPEDPRWFASENGRAAILTNPDALSGICVLARTAADYVAVKYKGLHIISTYLSPNVGINVFAELLDELNEFIRTTQGEIIVCGDFNAKYLGLHRDGQKGGDDSGLGS